MNDDERRPSRSSERSSQERRSSSRSSERSRSGTNRAAHRSHQSSAQRGNASRRRAGSNGSHRRTREEFIPHATDFKGNAPKRKKGNFLRNCTLAIICLVVIVCGFAFARSGDDAQGPEDTQIPINENSESQDGTMEVTPEETVVYNYEPTVSSIASVPTTTSLTTYDLTENPEGFDLSEQTTAAINQAILPFTENNIDIGFVLLDIGNGRGISYNPDQEVYGASAIKGPFSTYICQDLVDKGEIKLTGSCANYDENFKSKGTSTVKNQISNAIKWSSNGAFAGLRKTFGGSDYASWLTSLGVDPAIHGNGRWFAFFSPRDAAKLWMNTYLYFQDGTETSEWLKDLMSNTNRSMLRDGVAISENVLAGSSENSYVLVEYASEPEDGEEVSADAESGKYETADAEVSEEASSGESNDDSSEEIVKVEIADGVEGAKQLAIVLSGGSISSEDGQQPKGKIVASKDITFINKAGWCIDEKKGGDDYDALVDNGIITINDTDYLFCIMSSARDNEKNNARFTALISALFEACQELEEPVTV